MPKNPFKKISRIIRKIAPKRTRGSVTITPGDIIHTTTKGGPLGVFINESGPQNNFTYTVHPVLKKLK